MTITEKLALAYENYNTRVRVKSKYILCKFSSVYMNLDRVRLGYHSYNEHDQRMNTHQLEIKIRSVDLR